MSFFGFEGSESGKGGKAADNIFKGVQKDLSGKDKNREDIHAAMMQALLGPLEEQKKELHSIIFKNHFNPYSKGMNSIQKKEIQKKLDLLENYLIKIVNNQIKKSSDRSASHISKIFRNPTEMTRDHPCSNGKILTVTGTPDGLFFNVSKKEFVIWELKGMKKVDKEQLLTQVAVYAWLLKGRTSIPSSAVAFIFDSDEKIIRYSREEISKKVDELPVLFDLHQLAEESIKSAANSMPGTDREGICHECTVKDICLRLENEPISTIEDISD